MKPDRATPLTDAGESLAPPAPIGAGELALVAALLLVSILVQSWVVDSKRIPQSSDQAIVGLMAKHILERGDHPVFYYGSAYAGSLEPHYVAGAFALLGTSLDTYRTAMGALVLLIMLGTWAVTRRAFGRTAAILALAYLAVPPFYFLYKGLTSDGHYDAFNLFTVGVLLVCLSIEERLATGRDTGRHLYVLLGAVFGVGWWINPITPAVSAAAFAWLFVRKRARPPIRRIALIAAGFLIGSLPWTWWNVRHGWASLTAPELGRVGIPGALHNLGEILVHSLPLFAGGVRFRAGTAADTFPYSAVGVMLVFVVLLIPPVLRLLRGDRVVRLFLLCFAALVATVIWSGRYVPGEPRVLFPYYVLVPPVLAAGLTSIAAHRTGRTGLAAVLGGILLFANGFAMTQEHRHLRNTDGETTADLGPLESALRREGVRHVYADYWTAYRLAFESEETLIATPIPGDDLVRYLPYQKQVAADPSPAIVVRGSRDPCLTAYLRQRSLPHRRTVVPPFAVFTGLPREVNTFITEKGTLPLPDSAYKVTWRIGPHPATLPEKGATTATVSFRNVSPCTWPQAVHLGYHWTPVDPGLPRIWGVGRELPNRRIEPGEVVTLPVRVTAPGVPGRYYLVYDLVFENVDFFSTRGGATAAVPIAVR